MSYVYICSGMNAKILDNIIYCFRYTENYSSAFIWEHLLKYVNWALWTCLYWSESPGAFFTGECCSMQNYMESFTLTGSCWEKPLPLHYLLNFLLWLPNQNLDLLCSVHGIGLHSSMGYELDRTPHPHCQILRERETEEMLRLAEQTNLFNLFNYVQYHCWKNKTLIYLTEPKLLKSSVGAHLDLTPLRTRLN